MTREIGDGIETNRQSVVTTGTFDGVHLGHRAIVRYLVERAADIGGVPTVVTFDPHPRAVLLGHPIPLLTTLAERADALEELGVERFVVIRFSRDLSLLEPEDYIRDVLVDQVGMGEIVIGYDHRFGRKARGDRALLDAMGPGLGFSVDVIPEQILDDVTVSSTEIRRQLAEAGDAARAAELLGRPYRITGTVVRGDQRGRTIGYPTANVEPTDARKLVPKAGVYAVRARLADGSAVTGMMNIGRRPTFETDGQRTIEVHLFDVDRDLYGQRLTVDVIERIRDERRFDGADGLTRQLADDRRRAKWLLEGGK
ncbi:MAG: bifunctional riboflavin kinase/FAD synthetase [Bacteroidota bacterium]